MRSCCKVAELHDEIHPNANETLTVRSLFVIDPKKKVRLIINHLPASTGRNFDEVPRVIDSLQLTDSHSVATPGKALRPYLRMTPQPNR